MKETSAPDPPDLDRNRSGALATAYGFFRRSSSKQPSDSLPWVEPTAVNSNTNSSSNNNNTSNTNNTNISSLNAPDNGYFGSNADDSNSRYLASKTASNNVPATSSVFDEKVDSAQPATGSITSFSGNLAPAASSQNEGQGSFVELKEGQDASRNKNINNVPPTANSEDEESSKKKKRTLIQEIRRTTWMVMTYSWLNVMLVFVPVGIIVSQIPGINPGIVFGMNCIAVIPLAGLLAHATESVARKMGDALGALLNVTFGNAVELIIFIALQKNQIRIVQASLLGSILANLLLILGMGFFLGGLRYREQIYNSTVTQMSACLLSLSVISLVLPTAFHASFSDPHLADTQSLKISRGTSVILLLVYGIYLLFQLKSHAYMYESTPQHIVDAESTPGPAAGWLDSSSSDDSSSSSSDSDDSSHSRDTVRRRMKKVLRAGRKRKSSVASGDTNDAKATRSSSFGTANGTPNEEAASESSSARPGLFPRVPSNDTNDESAEEEKTHKRGRRHRLSRRSHKKSKKNRRDNDGADLQPTINEGLENGPDVGGEGEPRRVDFAIRDEPAAVDRTNEPAAGDASKRPFPTLRGISIKNLAPPVFVQEPDAGIPPPTASGPVPRVRYGIRRTNSLPDRLNDVPRAIRPPGALFPARVPTLALSAGSGALDGLPEDEEEYLSQTASVILLLVTTGLVAACAEFLVGSIEAVTKESSLGEIFIGLIILPIVGNAAEHVTAVTVAMKNKMDLAIGVAVGSSIQIAIFVTPLVVILGWIIGRDMTLYFTLFETVCLFVSAFMVNFLVLDGRSNYLEGALLCAVYLIIAVVAFFYPNVDDASQWGN